MKIREKNGHKYSLQEFEGYRFRAKFKAVDMWGEDIVNTDVYTDNDDRKEVEELLMSATAKKGRNIAYQYSGIVGWTSKEQDDLTVKFLEETFKGL